MHHDHLDQGKATAVVKQSRRPYRARTVTHWCDAIRGLSSAAVTWTVAPAAGRRAQTTARRWLQVQVRRTASGGLVEQTVYDAQRLDPGIRF